MQEYGFSLKKANEKRVCAGEYEFSLIDLHSENVTENKTYRL